MRLYVTALAACLVLGLTATAAAKEVSAVSVCGASGCNDVDDVQAFMAAGGLDSGSPDPQPMPAAQPYYRLDVELSAPGEKLPGWSVFLLADGSLVRTQGPGVGLGQDWLKMPVGSAGVIKEAVRGAEPFPAPRLTDVRVGGRRAPDLGPTGPVGRSSPASPPPSPQAAGSESSFARACRAPGPTAATASTGRPRSA